MKLVVIALAGAALFAVPVITASPVLAQGAVITTGPGGGSVTIREGGDRREWRERRRWREEREFRRHRAECRTIIERHRRPDGTLVVRKTRSC